MSDFDLSTAFAVREREDGLLEKDTFDLFTAAVVGFEAKLPDAKWIKDPSFEASWELVKSAGREAISQTKDVYNLLIGRPWASLTGQKMPETESLHKVLPNLVKVLSMEIPIPPMTPENIKGVLTGKGLKEQYSPGLEGNLNVLGGLLMLWSGTEAIKSYQGAVEFNKSLATLMKSQLVTPEQALAQSIAEGLPKYEKMFVGKGVPFAPGTPDDVKVKTIMANLKDNPKLQAEIFADAGLRSQGINPSTIVETTSYDVGESGNLFSKLKQLNQLVGKRGSISISKAKIGQKILFEGRPGEIVSIEGQRIGIQLLGDQGKIAIATLSQLSLPIPTEGEVSKPILETEQPEQLPEKQLQKPIQPKTPETPSLPPPITPPTATEGLPPETDPVKRIIQALKEAKPIRAEQEALMKAERGRRIAKAKAMGMAIGGEAGFHAQLGSLKGELPKAQFESLRGKITQGDIDFLFNKIRQSDMKDWDKISVQTGLGKILGEFGGKVPTENELKGLHEVFGKEFVDAVLTNRTLLQSFSHAAGQLLNIPRSVMASFDLSAPLRQGAFFAGRGKQWGPAFKEMFKYFGSEPAFKALQESIESSPNYNLMREHGLAITDLGAGLSTREERFMSSWAENIPVAGIGIRASGRAYVGFLNKLRADVFEDLYYKAKSLGIKETDKLLDDLVEFINTATGRGNFPGKLDQLLVALNSVFFSPRLMASRIQLLNPAFYITKEPFVRKEALKSLLSFSGIWMAILGLAILAGIEVGTDWRSSDFAKMKIRNTRIDLGAGFQQYLRMAGQLITGEYVSSVTGKTLTLGEGYKPLTRFDIVLRQLENKESPVASFITSLLRQQTFMGEDVSVLKEVGQRFTPMVLGDLVDLANTDPALLPLGILGLFGVGLQTYESRSRLSTRGLKKRKRGLK